MTSTPIGSEFTAVREKKGLDINQVSQLLKIKPQKILAIEQDAYENCTLSLYDIGYIKSYAALLKLDPQVIQNKLSLRGFKLAHQLEHTKQITPPTRYYKILIPITLLALIWYIDEISHTTPQVIESKITQPFGYTEN
ncbi:helix-turn-helix domain-containing protein [Gammaproteobacteria bacterium]|nr:helix-turn-helix domain-containing protein [Gammaproteobacteria bacterium]